MEELWQGLAMAEKTGNVCRDHTVEVVNQEEKLGLNCDEKDIIELGSANFV